MSESEFNHPAERERSPPEAFFNVDVMSDDQVVVLHRALFEATIDFESPNAEFSPGDIVETMHWTLLGEARNMAEYDPDRVRRIAEWCGQSDESADWLLGAQAACGLVHMDYPYTRDTLVMYATDSKYHNSYLRQYAMYDIVSELMRDHMTPEQIEDFNTHAAASGERQPFSPALPKDWYTS